MSPRLTAYSYGHDLIQLIFTTALARGSQVIKNDVMGGEQHEINSKSNFGL